jgi:CDP-glucose 4,6-dehydratase
VRDLIAAFETAFAVPLPWRQEPATAEAQRLALDPALAGRMLGWRPRLDRAACIAATAGWYAAWARGEDMLSRSQREVREALA